MGFQKRGCTPVKLYHNLFSGVIPDTICSFNFDWVNGNNFSLNNNLFCPPYPDCVVDFVGEQDTSDCP